MLWSLWRHRLPPENDALWYRDRPYPFRLLRRQLVALRDDFRKSANPPKFTEGAYSQTKEFRARSALVHLGDFAAAGVGWALNHIVGRALAKSQGVEPAITPAWVHKKDPRFVEMFNRTNDEALERAGAAYEFDNAEVNREVLIEFLRLFGNGHPLFQQGAEALEAAAFGSSHPWLKRSQKPTRGGDGLALWRLRLEAVTFAHYRHGRGETIDAGYEYVASNLSVSRDTVESWERETATRFGKLHVLQRCGDAQAHGKIVRDWEAACGPKTDAHGRETDEYMWWRAWGDEGLLSLAKRFKLTRAPAKTQLRG